MKRYFIILAVVFIGALILSSCKGSEKCPAYGQADQEQAEQNI
ncbi:MAG: hypothetical protein ABIJ16_04930 [Bacteroidota bacterium]